MSNRKLNIFPSREVKCCFSILDSSARLGICVPRPAELSDGLWREANSIHLRSIDMHMSNIKMKSFFSILVASLLGCFGSVAQAGPMQAGQSCTAGSPTQGCVPGIYCVAKNGSPAFNGGGTCYPPGVPLGFFDTYSPAKIANFTAVDFLTVGVDIQKWYAFQIQAITVSDDAHALSAAVPGMTLAQIQMLTPAQRAVIKGDNPNTLRAWVARLPTDQRQALGF